MVNIPNMQDTLAAIEMANSWGRNALAAEADVTPLGPTRWEDYVGQDRVKRRLSLAARRARETARPMPHALLVAPPGAGKTTLARLIATTLDRPLVEIVEQLTPRQLALKAMEAVGGVLFLDEIHLWQQRTSVHALMQLLYTGQMDVMPGMPFDDVTIVGATTEPGMLFGPLMGRFPMAPGRGLDFVEYTDVEMQLIVQGMAERAGVDLDADTFELLATAANGVPREAEWMILAARDMSFGGEAVDGPAILELMGLDPDGLTYRAQQVLARLAMLGPQSEATLMATLRLSRDDLRAAERILLKLGYIEITNRRQATPKGTIRAQPMIKAQA